MVKPNSSQGTPPDNKQIYQGLFYFMDEVLYEYKPLKKETEEDKITQDVELFLNEKTRVVDTCFCFQNQRKVGVYRTDIAVCLRSNYECFCWIEAKRLPTPLKNNDRDEREYVIVDKQRFKGNGGIQRFKEGKHAPNLPYSIMIGYIQDNNNADYWLQKINTWIMEMVNINKELWSKDEYLKKYYPNKCDRFLSTHKREDKTTIILHHYWIRS